MDNFNNFASPFLPNLTRNSNGDDMAGCGNYLRRGARRRLATGTYPSLACSILLLCGYHSAVSLRSSSSLALICNGGALFNVGVSTGGLRYACRGSFLPCYPWPAAAGLNDPLADGGTLVYHCSIVAHPLFTLVPAPPPVSGSWSVDCSVHSVPSSWLPLEFVVLSGRLLRILMLAISFGYRVCVSTNVRNVVVYSGPWPWLRITSAQTVSLLETSQYQLVVLILKTSCRWLVY